MGRLTESPAEYMHRFWGL